ncbi:MAG: energy-coupling factor transporter transmembrane protein EcfT [Oscillospiraceae bacterium]|nr:energy-coupling factor transporter transmembrane protein EcfT [Oscillospiraceae bacterium]
MFGEVTVGQYIHGESALHRADPRTKLIAAVALFAVVFLIRGYVPYLALAAALIAVAACSRLPLRFVLKGLKSLRLIIVFSTAVNILFNRSGEALLEAGPLTLTTGAAYAGFSLLMRLTIIITAGSVLTLTTTPIGLAGAVESLLSPLKAIRVPVHEMSMVMTIAIRFIPTISAETARIMKAQAARGSDFDTGGLVGKARSLIPILVPLFVSAIRRADELAVAMESRCYRGGEGRTKLRSLRFGKVDLAVALCAAAAFTAFIAFGRLPSVF